jgi:hypothetical protein
MTSMTSMAESSNQTTSLLAADQLATPPPKNVLKSELVDGEIIDIMDIMDIMETQATGETELFGGDAQIESSLETGLGGVVFTCGIPDRTCVIRTIIGRDDRDPALIDTSGSRRFFPVHVEHRLGVLLVTQVIRDEQSTEHETGGLGV